MMVEPPPKPAFRQRSSGAARHSAARLAAVQALYQIEMTGATASQVIDEFERHRLGKPDESGAGRKASARRFGELVRGVRLNAAELDDAIRPLLAEGWQVERLEIVLRCILRLAAWELKTMFEVPARVVISEYVSLAGDFYSGPEPGAVNGILDRLARIVRPGELEAKRDGSRRSGPPAG